jgi:type II secretory pathway component PulF
LLSKIPLFGPLWEWSGVAEMTRLLAMLMQQQVPLPRALRLATDGIRDANVRQVCQALAERTEQGQPLSDILSQERRLPALLAAIVRSGEQSGSLPDAFGVASEIYEGRVMLRALVLRTILPPLAFLLVAIAMVFIIGSLLTPMLSLLNGLSAGPSGPAAAESLGALNLIGLILLGAALLWTVYLVYGRRGLTSDDALKRILIIAAWTMIFMGALGLITGLTGFAAVALWLIIPVVVIISVHKYRVSESRALLWVLAIAAERGIPLERVVRAFADGRSDEMGLRALRLADLLDAGVPLPAALRQSRHPLPRDAVLAVGIGCEMGQLGPALRQVIVRYEEFGSMLEALLWKLFYLMLLVGFIMLIVFFVSLKIVPVYGMIMADFGLAMPALTDWVIASGDAIAQFWLVPFAFLLLLGLAICLLYYLNWMPIDLPLLGRSRLRYDGALIMRSLALAVRRNHALGDVLRMLAWQYPRANVRARLWRVGEQMRQGEDWCESLRRVRLIANADAAVLKAAQRVGNLAWALDEMADSSLRRWAYRLRAVLNVVFPLLLLAIGIFVMLIVIGLFLPLIKLIEGLT